MSIELARLLVTNPDFILGALFGYAFFGPEFEFHHFQEAYGDFPVFVQRAMQAWTNLLKVIGSGLMFRSYFRDLIPFMNTYFGTFIFNCLVLVFHNIQVAQHYMRVRLEYAAQNMFNARFLEYIPAGVNLFNVLQDEVRRQIENAREIPLEFQVIDTRNPFSPPRDVRTLSFEEAPYFEYIHGGPPVLPRGPAAQPQEPAAQPQQAPLHRVPPFSGLNDVPLPLTAQDPRIERVQQQRREKRDETQLQRVQRERRERRDETPLERVQRERRERRDGVLSDSAQSSGSTGAGRFPSAKPLVTISERKQMLPYLDIKNDYQTFH
jgi:hypothetical protein